MRSRPTGFRRSSPDSRRAPVSALHSTAVRSPAARQVRQLMADTHRIAVRVRGSIRGTAVDLDGAVRLIDDAVSIVVQDREFKARFDRIDGVVWEAPMLTLYVGQPLDLHERIHARI